MSSEEFRGNRIRVLEGALEEIIRKTASREDPVVRDLYHIAREARHGRNNGSEILESRERRAG